MRTEVLRINLNALKSIRPCKMKKMLPDFNLNPLD
ncbi:MAG: hypothetical protein QOH06_2698 [Acidobacteriota bacterium]|jgi:hypothetical protein|nr:hypothetical protein [Acidobacteriota bacterium]